MGYSMGGFHTPNLAVRPTNSQGPKFDRYVAIDTPVQLDYAMSAG